MTSVPNFPSGKVLAPYRNRLLQRETMEGIEIVRVWTYLAPNRAIVRRSLDFASFGLTGFFAGLMQKADVIMATSPQLLAGLSGRLLAMAKGRPYLLEIRDLWPDSIVALDMMRERHLMVRLLRAVENMLYRSAARIVTTNGGLRQRLIERGVPGAKIGVVPNGVDAVQFSPRPRPQALLEKYGLSDRFVVGYIGTQGLAHDMETVIDAADALRDTNVSFLFVGDGAQHLSIVRKVKRLRLANVHFVRTVAPGEVPDHIACCDVLLVPMKRTDDAQRYDAVQDIRDRIDGTAHRHRRGRHCGRACGRPSRRPRCRAGESRGAGRRDPRGCGTEPELSLVDADGQPCACRRFQPRQVRRPDARRDQARREDQTSSLVTRLPQCGMDLNCGCRPPRVTPP